MNTAEIRRLIQQRYYDRIDSYEGGAGPASAFTEDVDFSHQRAWREDTIGLDAGELTRLSGRPAVQRFLDEATPHLREAGLRHTIVDIVSDVDRGALVAEVTSTIQSGSAQFVVWFTLEGAEISRYAMRPL